MKAFIKPPAPALISPTLLWRQGHVCCISNGISRSMEKQHQKPIATFKLYARTHSRGVKLYALEAPMHHRDSGLIARSRELNTGLAQSAPLAPVNRKARYHATLVSPCLADNCRNDETGVKVKQNNSAICALESTGHLNRRSRALLDPHLASTSFGTSLYCPLPSMTVFPPSRLPAPGGVSWLSSG